MRVHLTSYDVPVGEPDPQGTRRHQVQRLLERRAVHPLPDDHADDQQAGHENERKTEDEEPAHGAEGSLAGIHRFV